MAVDVSPPHLPLPPLPPIVDNDDELYEILNTILYKVSTIERIVNPTMRKLRHLDNQYHRFLDKIDPKNDGETPNIATNFINKFFK